MVPKIISDVISNEMMRVDQVIKIVFGLLYR